MIETEALVIGKGPAGIQAALYIKRGNVDVVVIGKDSGASVQATVVDNYYGIGSIGGKQLIERGIQQARDLGIDVVDGEVISLTHDGEYFYAKTSEATYRSITLCIATGAHRTIPRVRKIRNFQGKGVSYCAMCDAFFFKDRLVGVLGSGDYADHEYRELKAMAKEVIVFTQGDEVTGQFEDATFVTEPILEVLGDDLVQGVRLESGIVELDGLFVAMGIAGSSELALQLGVVVDMGKIWVDEEFQTSLPGCFAVGDCTAGVQQIAKAVYDGCIAGMNIVNVVRKKKKEFDGI